MEETQSNQQEPVQGVSQTQDNGVSFPTVGNERKNGGAKTLLVIGILVLIGVLGYVIYKSASNQGETLTTATPASYNNMVAPQEEATSTPVASPSSTPVAVDREEIKIQIQNGTGITGEAAYLQNILKGMGYTEVAVGNSSTQDKTDTTVSFGGNVPTNIVTEITSKLGSIYQTVTKITSTSTNYDVVIVTGLRKGATAKPSASPTATP